MTDAERAGATGPDIDSAEFRRVLGHFCTGVAVVTAVDDGTPVGFSCQSFTSLSLDPPLVAFCPAKTSTTWPRIRRAGRFCANVLAADQQDVCRAFATSGGDKFAAVRWQPGPAGSPLLDGVVAWVEAEIAGEVDAGDHVIVIGRVLALGAAGDAEPLLFYRGRYVALAEAAGTAAVTG